MNDHDLSELLKVARLNNQAKAITGMLLYGDSCFIQVLEGNSEDIELTYSIIQADTRHTNITRILSGKISKRNFPDWKMGFMSVDADELKKLEGYINMGGTEFLKNEPVQTPIMVLRTFAKANKLLFDKL